MTNFDDDLQHTWRSAEPPMAPLVNIQRERIKLLVSMVLGVMGVLLSWWFVWQRPDAVTWALAVMVTLVVVTLSGIEWWIRRFIWRALAQESALSFIAKMTYRLQTEWRIWRLSRSGLVVVTLFLLVWTPWKLMVDAEVYIRTPIAAVIGVGGMVVILAGQYVVLARKRRALVREEQALRALRQDFESDAHTEDTRPPDMTLR